MRQILEIEEHVAVPPNLYSDPFYRITYLIKQEIRSYKWTNGEKGRQLSWEEARAEWTEAHRKAYENFSSTLCRSQIWSQARPPP